MEEERQLQAQVDDLKQRAAAKESLVEKLSLERHAFDRRVNEATRYLRQLWWRIEEAERRIQALLAELDQLQKCLPGAKAVKA